MTDQPQNGTELSSTAQTAPASNDESVKTEPSRLDRGTDFPSVKVAASETAASGSVHAKTIGLDGTKPGASVHGSEKSSEKESTESLGNSTGEIGFRDLQLIAPIHEALEQAGYEVPTPIQAATIPPLLAGRDVLGQAQTGTGKTAAFALPLLSRINLQSSQTQVLVLTPTRELAIQVADSFKRYAKCMKGLRVAPIYGGQAYSTQINQLERGLHVVVGTPGRVMDHMRQQKLKIDELKCLVLDEADEMLRMGFVDDVQWILSHTPAQRQIALFSATMPSAIRKIADEHLKNPEIVTIDAQQRTAETIRQRYIMMPHRSKYDALIRVLECEETDGVIIFIKTKAGTVELSENLQAAGYLSAALNGDVAQSQRERTVDQLKSGVINIIAATDVAARGLDVPRISHVINYDLPFDTEAYVHRIGRTGRAGRSGEAILFVAPSERGFLRVIERGTSQTIEPMPIPTAKTINELRQRRFKEKISAGMKHPQFKLFESLIAEYQNETQSDPSQIAAAIAAMTQGSTSMFVVDREPNVRDSYASDRHSSDRRGQRPDRGSSRDFDRRDNDRRDNDRAPRQSDFRDRRSESSSDRPVDARPARSSRPFEGERRSDGSRSDSPRSDGGRESFRIEVGLTHGVKPANIVGAIVNEAGIDSALIGDIKILDDHSIVDLPSGMPRDIFRVLGRAWVMGKQLRISKLSDFYKNGPEKPKYKTKEKAKDKDGDKDKAKDQDNVKVQDKAKDPDKMKHKEKAKDKDKEKVKAKVETPEGEPKPSRKKLKKADNAALSLEAEAAALVDSAIGPQA
ncbi:MAG: DEAD/DEAH box helicase [Planctomycetota bacterium]|nr:DEAD/DEAH box helicase [Planctomycetota bacterium]